MSPHLIMFLVMLGCQAEAVVMYGIGRANSRRALERAEDEGYDAGRTDGYDDALADAAGEADQIAAPGPAGPQHLGAREREPQPAPDTAYPAGDWREQMKADLAEEALAHDLPRPGGLLEGPEVPEPRWDVPGQAVTPSAGPGQPKPSPYPGQPTPAQRRRDKHKHRGQFAPAPGWSGPGADMLRPSWKPEGQHFMADWQIQWHADVAAVDEEIAAWSERARTWLASDPWDRSARRLEVA